MTHPITPSSELIVKWRDEWYHDSLESKEELEWLVIRAAQWGADHELEACCHLLQQQGFDVVDDLRASRRPKPSTKEQALFAVAVLTSPDETCSIAEVQQHWHTIRRALEELPDD